MTGCRGLSFGPLLEMSGSRCPAKHPVTYCCPSCSPSCSIRSSRRYRLRRRSYYPPCASSRRPPRTTGRPWRHAGTRCTCPDGSRRRSHAARVDLLVGHHRGEVVELEPQIADAGELLVALAQIPPPASVLLNHSVASFESGDGCTLRKTARNLGQRLLQIEDDGLVELLAADMAHALEHHGLLAVGQHGLRNRRRRASTRWAR